MERGARLSGSRFAYLRGDLVLLEFALVRYALEKLRGEGFEPVIPPVLVRERALYGTGFLPDTEQQIYRLPDDDLYLVGTSEVAWPRCTTTRSSRRRTCRAATPGSRPASAARPAPPARTPAASSGSTSSTRSRCSASWRRRRGWREHERLLAIEESILTELEIPYRVVAIAVDDLGASAAKKYDCEAWLPGQGRYRELTSTSQHHRLPGPPAGHPLPPGRRPAGARPHAERHRGGGRADDHRPARERPAGGRLGPAAGAVGGVWRARSPPPGEPVATRPRNFRHSRRGLVDGFLGCTPKNPELRAQPGR